MKQTDFEARRLLMNIAWWLAFLAVSAAIFWGLGLWRLSR